MKNTNNLVVQKALNEYNSFGNKIMDKNETLRDKLGIDKIPSLKEYENLIKNFLRINNLNFAHTLQG